MATHSSSIGGVEVEVMEPAGWRLSWGAVLAGVIVSLVAHILLNLLGIGIGVASTEPNATPDAQTVQNAGLAASIWWAVAGILAAAIGGYFAGRTMGAADKDDGMIHGLLAWAATTLVIAFLLTSVLGGALAGAMGRFGDVMQQANIQMPGAQRDQAVQGNRPAPQQTTPEQRETARNAIAGSALASFVALLLGAVAAGVSGRFGVKGARRALRDD